MINTTEKKWPTDQPIKASADFGGHDINARRAPQLNEDVGWMTRNAVVDEWWLIWWRVRIGRLVLVRQWILDCGGFLESEIHIEKALWKMPCMNICWIHFPLCWQLGLSWSPGNYACWDSCMQKHMQWKRVRPIRPKWIGEHWCAASDSWGCAALASPRGPESLRGWEGCRVKLL